MQIKCNLNDFESKQGVYVLRNLETNKCYIGSTIMTFKKRMEHHLWNLRENKHKNQHLQNAWNKYGEDSFEYDILEICERKDCLKREQYYLDTILFAQDFINNISKKFLELGYNINPIATGTPNLSKETIIKRSKTFAEYVKTASSYYKKLKSFEIDFEDIPDKYLSIIKGWYYNVPWNKGKHYNSTDHLKVPKKISQKVLESRQLNSQRAREKSKKILVFDINNNYLGTWRSPTDLHEWSLSNFNNYPLILKGKAKSKELLAQNIIKSCKTNKSYKGLYFKYDALFKCKFKNEEDKNGEG